VADEHRSTSYQVKIGIHDDLPGMLACAESNNTGMLRFLEGHRQHIHELAHCNLFSFSEHDDVRCRW
jgi:hypothetical protein